MILLDYSTWNSEIHLFFLRKLAKLLQWSSLPCFILPKSFSLDTSDKSTFQITSSCLIICWRKVDGILYPSLTTISSKVKIGICFSIFGFLTSDEKSSSAAVLIYFPILYQPSSQILVLNNFSFLFLQTSLFVNLISLLWILCCFPSWVPPCFGVSVFCIFPDAVNVDYCE